MKTLRTINYHIKGTPTMDECQAGSVKGNYLKADVYYSEGGYSYFTYKNTPRGYFMSVVDVGMARDNYGISTSHTLFNDRGRKYMIKEVTRQSKKAEAEALAYFEEHIADFVKQVYPECETEVE